MSSEALRVIAIGLDGATFDLILPWCREGRLPGFQAIMNKGVWAELESTVPPLTGPAWSSFMTGKNPGKHGIYDFMRRRPGDYRWDTINGTQRKGPSFWRLLSDAGKRVAVFNVPVSYPPEEVNGVMISGYLTPPRATDFIYPLSLKADLERETGMGSTFFPGATYSLGREEKFIRAVDEMTDRTARVMDYLMAREPWDCFVGVFQGTDLLQHCLWKEMNHPLLGKAFLDLYQRIDRYLQSLLDRMDDRTVLFVLSDHGFGDLKRQVFLNTWLLDQGFLKLKSGLAGRVKRAIFDLGLVPMKLHQLAVRLGLDLSDQMMENRESLFSFLGRVTLSLDDVDWPRTRVYAMGNMGYLSLNVVGREPQGCVRPEDYEGTLIEIKEALAAMRDPESGEPVIDRVFRREELYHGPCAAEAPDLFPMPRDFRYHLRGDSLFLSRRWIENDWLISGFHRMNGIFFAQGRPIRSGGGLERKRIVDLAPTILACLGVPIPDDMDGAVVADLFTEEARVALAPRYCPAGESEGRGEKDLSEEEQREIRNRLQSLGYIG
jgi:predicted AlkP superfamily phosphohydrolase/phosphomutase